MEEDEPVYTEDIEPLHDPMTVIDKGTALKYYDAGATIYLITPFFTADSGKRTDGN